MGKTHANRYFPFLEDKIFSDIPTLKPIPYKKYQTIQYTKQAKSNNLIKNSYLIVRTKEEWKNEC